MTRIVNDYVPCILLAHFPILKTMSDGKWQLIIILNNPV
jgi:hypothetical protein